MIGCAYPKEDSSFPSRSAWMLVALKARFLPARHVEFLDGKTLDMPASTRLLSVEEFAAYMHQFRLRTTRGAKISAAYQRKSEEEKRALREKTSAALAGRPKVRSRRA